jgi:hypothetical protein
MWDVAGGGLPLAPVGRALKALGKDYSRISLDAARRDTMQALWQESGLQAVETRVIPITVTFASFDDFCESNLVPIGPAGQVIAKMAPAELEQLKANLRTQLPIAADGSIAYEAFANAVKGRVAK